MSADGQGQFSDPQVRITLRPLGSPLPLGLFSFGIGMLVLGAQSLGWVPPAQELQVGLVLAGFVFPLEGLAAIFAFLSRDTLGATVLSFFTTSWLLFGIVFILGPPGATSVALGFYLLGFAGAVVLLASVATLGKPLISLTLFLSATRAILDGIYEVSGSVGLQHASGIVALAICAVAGYAGTAFVLEDLRQNPVLPVFRRGAATQAMDGDLDDQVEHSAGEAGIRQQL